MKFKILTKKGVFSYEYLDSASKLFETKLPPIECWYKKINGENICEEKYVHVHNVWQVFNISTLGEYSDVYMCTDILLLADVLEKFRTTSLHN